jgi:Zn-dependent protease with chaperone function
VASSPGRIYGFGAGLSLLGLATVALVLLVVGQSTTFAVPGLHELAMACREAVPSDVTLGSLAVLGLAAIGVAAIVRGAVSATRQLSAHRRLMAAVAVRGRRSIGGVEVAVIAGAAPQAFCAGCLRPQIYLSEGALALTPSEVLAVVAHEAHHEARRDPLRLLVARILSAGLFFLPVLGRLNDRYESLAELAADDAASAEPASRRALASALLKFESAGAAVVGIAPERVDHLLGRRPRWELPVSLLLASLIAVGSLVTVALVTALTVDGGAVSASLLLGRSCRARLVAVPLLLGAGVLWSRGASSPRPGRRG